VVKQNDIAFSPSQIDPGDVLKISVNVRNVGTLDANNVLIRIQDGSPASAASQVLTEFRRICPPGIRSVDV
jgi:hypothetical protein